VKSVLTAVAWIVMPPSSFGNVAPQDCALPLNVMAHTFSFCLLKNSLGEEGS
jgi:hypothetical protein